MKHRLLLSVIFAALACSSQAQEISRERLRSNDSYVLKENYDKIIGDRQKLIADLIATVDMEIPWEELTFSDPRLTAIQLLGELRSTEAIDVLIKRIDIHLKRITGINHHLGEPKATVLALARIGKPASSAALEQLKVEESEYRRMLLCEVIIEVEGREVGGDTLQDAISRSTNQLEKNRLKAARPYFKKKS